MRFYVLKADDRHVHYYISLERAERELQTKRPKPGSGFNVYDESPLHISYGSFWYGGCTWRIVPIDTEDA